jgi:hypothetical protein
MTHPAIDAIAVVEGETITSTRRGYHGQLGLVLGERGYLRMGDAAWRIRSGESTVDGSYAEVSEGTRPLDITGARIVSIDVDERLADVTIELSNGMTIEVFALSAYHPVLYLFDSAVRVLRVGPGSAWALEPVDGDTVFEAMAAERPKA